MCAQLQSVSLTSHKYVKANKCIMVGIVCAGRCKRSGKNNLISLIVFDAEEQWMRQAAVTTAHQAWAALFLRLTRAQQSSSWTEAAKCGSCFCKKLKQELDSTHEETAEMSSIVLSHSIITKLYNFYIFSEV